MNHFSDVEILTLAQKKVEHDHFKECAFCREQYEFALDLERFMNMSEEERKNAVGDPKSPSQ